MNLRDGIDCLVIELFRVIHGVIIWMISGKRPPKDVVKCGSIHGFVVFRILGRKLEHIAEVVGNKSLEDAMHGIYSQLPRWIVVRQAP
jgi:hypothetical protein